VPSETNEGSPSNRPNGTNSGKYAWGHATSDHESKRSVTSKSVDAEQIDIRRSTEYWAESRILNADPSSFIQFIKVEKQEKPVTDATPKAKLEKETSEFDKWFRQWKPGDQIPATKPGTRLVISSDFTGKLSGKKITPKPKFKLNDKPVEVKGILGESLGENKKYLNLLLRVARSRGIPFDEEGRLRCPEDTPGGGQFTDLQMSNCMIPSGRTVAGSISADRILGVRKRALSWLEQIADSLDDTNDIYNQSEYEAVNRDRLLPLDGSELPEMEITKQSLLERLISDLQTRENRINAGMSVDDEPDVPDGPDDPSVGGRVEENGNQVIGFREMLMRKAFISLAMRTRNKTLDNALKKKYGIELKNDDDYQTAMRKIFPNLDQQSIDDLFTFPNGSFVNATAEANFRRHHREMLRAMMLEAVDNPEVARRLSGIDVVDSANDLNFDNNGTRHDDIAQANLQDGVFSIAIFPHNYEGFLQQLGDKSMQKHMAFGSSTDPDVVGHYVGVHEFGHLADFYYKAKKLGISEDGSLIPGSEIWNKYNDRLSDNDPDVRKQAFEDMWNEVADYIQGYNGDMDLEKSLMPLVGSNYGYANTIEAAAEFYSAYRLLRPFLTKYNKENPDSVDADQAFKEMFETTSKVGGEALPAVRKLSLMRAALPSAVRSTVRRGSGRNRRLRTTGQGLFRSRPRRTNSRTFKNAVSSYVSNIVPSSSNNATFWAMSNNQRLEKRGWLLPIYALDDNSAKVLSDSAEKALRDIEDRWRKELGLVPTETLDIDDMLKHLNTLEGAKHGVFRTYLHNLVTLDEMLRTGDMSLINDVKIKQRHSIFEDMGLSFGGKYRGTSGSASSAMPFNMRANSTDENDALKVSGSITSRIKPNSEFRASGEYVDSNMNLKLRPKQTVQPLSALEKTKLSSQPKLRVSGSMGFPTIYQPSRTIEFEMEELNYNGSSIDSWMRSADIYSIGGENIVFGEDKVDDPSIKVVPLNPYVISGLDAISDEGRELADKWWMATVAQMQEDDARAARPSALLYAASRGDENAKQEFERLSKSGKEILESAREKTIKSRTTSLYDTKRPEERTEEWWKKNAPTGGTMVSIQLSPWEKETRLMQKDDLFFVHQTKFEPEIDPETGDLLIRTTSEFDGVDAETGEVALDPVTGRPFRQDRFSVHFALNHLVEGHLARPTPTEKTFAIISPLTSVLDSNEGSLDNLMIVDSWVTPKPGEPLRIPKGSYKLVELPSVEDHTGVKKPSGRQSDWSQADNDAWEKALADQRANSDKIVEDALQLIGKMNTGNDKYETTILPGGESYSSSRNATVRVADIAKELGVESGMHTGSPSEILENLIAGKRPEISEFFRWNWDNPEDQRVPYFMLSKNQRLQIANGQRFVASRKLRISDDSDFLAGSSGDF